MNPIRAATLSVVDIATAVSRFEAQLDFQTVEQSTVSSALAASLDAPDIAGARQAILRPASGRKTDLRLIEVDSAHRTPIMASIGWTALEICVADVHAAHTRFADGPFAVIGPPAVVGGLPTIHPMQVEGPDGEILFLTQILTRDPAAGLPVAKTPIDVVFIVVLACRDLAATATWVERELRATVAAPVKIPYRTLSRAFDLPPEHLHTITTASCAGQIFLELDQYPAQANDRDRTIAGLTRGVAMISLLHDDLERVTARWHVPPTRQDGAIYEGRRAGVIATPEGALIELVESRA